MLILAAISFVVAIGYCTGVLTGFGSTLSSSTSKGYYANSNFEAGGNLYIDAQSFNDALLYLSIVLILAVVCLYITATNTRRNYYVSNYVVSIVVAVIFVAVSVYVMINNGIYLSRVYEVFADEEAMEWYYNRATTRESMYYSKNIAMFIITYIVYALDILAAVALVLNSVWKHKLMKGEKALLEQGTIKEVA